MKKFISILLALALSASLVGCGTQGSSSAAQSQAAAKTKLDTIKENGYITVAISPDFGPYEFIDLNKEGQDSVVGCEVEFAKYVAEYLGVELKIEQMDFATCQAAVSQGKVDLSVSGYAKTDERAENMECSDYYNWDADTAEDGQGLIVLKENADKYATAESFAGKKVAAQNGSLQYNLVTSQLPSDVELQPVSATTDGVMMVITGKVDALASSYDTGLQFCKNYDTITMAPFKFEYQSEGNIALAQKGQTELMAEVNAAIAKAKEEGKFLQWKTDAVALCDQLGVDVN